MNDLNLRQYNPNCDGRGRKPKHQDDKRDTFVVTVALNAAEFNLYVRAKNHRMGKADGQGRVGHINRDALVAVWEQVLRDGELPKPKRDLSRAAEEAAGGIDGTDLSDQKQWLDSLAPVDDVASLLNDALGGLDIS